MFHRKIRSHAVPLVLAALGVLAFAGLSRIWADTGLPRVRFLATGGTIATRGNVRLSAAEILELAPGLSRYARPEPEQFSNIASTAMTLEQWLQLSAR